MSEARRRAATALAAAGTVLLPPAFALLSAVRLNGRRTPLAYALALYAGAALWVLPLANEGLGTGAWAAAQALALVLCGTVGLRQVDRGHATLGIVAGLVLMAALSPLSSVGGRWAGWSAHPNIWAGKALLPALAGAALAPRRHQKGLALAVGLAVVLASGSRGQLAALAVGACVLAWLGFRGRARLALLAGLLAVTAALALTLPRSRALLADAARNIAGGVPSTNLVQGSGEALLVSRGPSADGGVTTLVKLDPAPHARLQYPLILHPDSPYTVSVELRADDDEAETGLWGAGRDPVTREQVEVRLLRAGGEWIVESRGPVEVQRWSAEPLTDGWVRLELTLTSRAPSPVWWWVGPTPDQRDGGVGSSVDVRRLQFELGEAATPYVDPSDQSLATVQALARLSAFRAAWSGFLSRPWLGQGVGAFADHYRLHPPGQDIAVPAHAHNVLLQMLFSRGVIGASGALLVLTALVWRGARASRTTWAMVAALFVSWAVDDLLTASGQVYALAAWAALAEAASPADRERP